MMIAFSFYQILYIGVISNDHLANRHTPPNDVVLDVQGSLLDDMWYSLPHRSMFGLSYTGTTNNWKYSIVESMALPFYIQHILNQRAKPLFDIQLRDMKYLLIVIDILMKYDVATKPTRSSTTTVMEMRDKFTHHLRNLLVGAIDCASDVIDVWLYAINCEICVVTSVLLMSKRHSANEWSEKEERIIE